MRVDGRSDVPGAAAHGNGRSRANGRPPVLPHNDEQPVTISVRGHCSFVGLATLDVILGVDAFPKSNEKLTSTRDAFVAGGPAANAAVTCAYLGRPAVLATALGGTAVAAFVRSDLDDRNVRVVDVDPHGSQAPPVAAIIVTMPTGDRAVVSPGATASSAEPNAAFEASIRASCAVLVDGHHPKLALAAVRIAREAGIHTILDGGSWKAATDALLPFIDTAICSDDFRPPHVASDERLAFLESRGVRFAAITRGARPILWSCGDERGELYVAPNTVVDTLGAGDVFHGAFAAATCEQTMTPDRFVSALAYAGNIATRSCASFGTRAWMSGGIAGEFSI